MGKNGDCKWVQDDGTFKLDCRDGCESTKIHLVIGLKQVDFMVCKLISMKLLKI